MEKKEIKQAVLDLAEKIKADLLLEETSVKETERGKAYESNVPDGLSMETIGQVHDYNTTFIAASAQAFNDMAFEAMKKDSKIDQINGNIGMYKKDNIELSFARSESFSAGPKGQPGEQVVKFGVSKAKVEFTAGGSGGELKKIRQNFNQLAAEAFQK